MSNTLPTTVTPVLSSTVGYITDVRDQIASAMRYILVNPGFTSSLWEDDLVSFRVISSKYDADPDELSAKLNLGLTSIFGRMFPDYQITNNITTEPYYERDGIMVRLDEDLADSKLVRYSVNFEIIISTTDISPENDIPEEGSIAIVSGSFTVDPTTNIIDIQFANNMDNDFITNK